MKKILPLLLLSSAAYGQGVFQYPHYQPNVAVTAGTSLVSPAGTPAYYVLSDRTPGAVPIDTKNAQGNEKWFDAIDIRDNDNVWNNSELFTYMGRGNFVDLSTALDAHWGMIKATEYFKRKFNWNSFDNRGTKIVNIVNYADATKFTTANAFWGAPNYNTADPYGAVMYTRGTDQGEYDPTDLHVVGHEFGHGINFGTARLAHGYESGALVEGFADIWAACITNDQGMYPWLGISEGPQRDMSNPNRTGCPAYYGGDGVDGDDPYTGINYWALQDGYGSGTGDSHYMHTNSTVLSHWFYLLAVGKTGTTEKQEPYCVAGISIDKAASIAFETQKRLAGFSYPNLAHYIDAYRASLDATAALFGNDSPEMRSVREAWYAVGVGPRKQVSSYTIAAPAWNCSTTTGTFTLTSSVAGALVPAANWTVSPDNGTVITSQRNGVSQLTITRNGTSSGLITVSVVIPQGCTPPVSLSSAPVAVGLSAPGPITGYLDPVAGRLYAEIPAIPNATYNWYVNGVLRTSGVTGSSIFVLTKRNDCTTTYNVGVEAVYPNCGSSPRTSQRFYPDCSAVRTASVASVYPNPADTYLEVAPSGLSSSSETNELHKRESDPDLLEVRLCNSHGKVMRTSGSTRLDTHDLPNGVYILQIVHRKYTEQKQVLVQH